MDFAFNRHEPVYDRILFVLTLDRQKMKERILIGEEAQIRFRLQGDTDTDLLCDAIRPLGIFVKKISHRRSGENVCGVPYLERVSASQGTTGQTGRL